MFLFIIFIGVCIAVIIGATKSAINNPDARQRYQPQKPYNPSTFDLAQTLREQECFHAYYEEPVIKEHYNNIETIEAQYSVLYNLKQFHSPQMDNLISLCEKDISIAKEFCRLCKSYNRDIPPSYNTFKRLAIIYDKRKEYDKAIAVCVKSIELGFVEDGTPGKMYGRLARMIRLSGSDKSVDYYLGN